MYDVIIVGGGPAGLSAALVLGRCRRSVLVFDQGQPRNAAATAMHGFLSRDGINPLELLRMSRRELRQYPVRFRKSEVIDAKRAKNHFDLKTHDASRFRCRKLLLATGMRDQLPRLDGLTDLYGISIHHCPYCDGWEWRGRALAAYGDGKQAVGLALSLKNWSDDVLVCTNGQRNGLKGLRRTLTKHGIKTCELPIKRLQGRNGKLQRIVFADGSSIRRDALFFSTGQRQKSSLAEKLGCEFDPEGGVKVDKRERTCVPGLFLCGDASRDVQFVIQAAAEGAVAAVTINKEFQEEEGRTLERTKHKA